MNTWRLIKKGHEITLGSSCEKLGLVRNIVSARGNVRECVSVALMEESDAWMPLNSRELA